VLKRQNELLRATGLKLFSYFGVLPSGEILNDPGLDNFLSEQMFDEEFEFTVAEASSVGTSTLRCSLGKGDFRPFGIGRPVPTNHEVIGPEKRVMRKMNTFNLGDHLQQVADFDPNFPQEKSQFSSKASLPKGDQENSMSLFTPDDMPECSPFKMRGFEEPGLYTGTTTTQSNRSIPNSTHQIRLSPNKKEIRFMGPNKIEKQPSMIKEEDPVDSLSAHHSSNGPASKPYGSNHEPHQASEISKKSNSKTEPQTVGAVITNLNQIGKVGDTKLFSDQSIKVKSKNSQTQDACPQPTVVEESQQPYFDSLANNNDSGMDHSSIAHIRLSNTMSDSSRLAIKHDESIVNCAELDRAEGIEMVLGYQTNLEPEVGPDTPIAGEGNIHQGDVLDNFSRFRSEKPSQHPQSYFEKQKSTENPGSPERQTKSPIALFEVKASYSKHIQSEIDEIEHKIQLYKLRDKQLDESLKANHLSFVAARNPDQVQSETVFEDPFSKHGEFGPFHRKEEPRKPLPTILKSEEFNLLFGSMRLKDPDPRKSEELPSEAQLESANKFSMIPSQPQPQTPRSKIEKITNELRNSIKRHSLNKTSINAADLHKDEKSERVNLNNLNKIQPVKHFEVGKHTSQGHFKTSASASKPPSPSNHQDQANTKKSANSNKAADFFKLSSYIGKQLGTPTSKKEKIHDSSLKTAIASKLENSHVQHASKNISFEPVKALVSNLIKSSHEIQVKKFNPQQSVAEVDEEQDAKLAAKESRKFQPKSKTVFRRENPSSKEKANSQVFLYSSANNPLKKQHANDNKLTQSTTFHHSAITSKLLKSAIDLKTEKANTGVDFSAAKRSRQNVEPETPPHLQRSTQPATIKLAAAVTGKQKLAQTGKTNFTSALTHEMNKTMHTVSGVSNKMLQAVNKKHIANQPIKKASVDFTTPNRRPEKQQ
jgi:hypothetical protein